MSDFRENLPPDVETSDIPGSRKVDTLREKYEERFDKMEPKARDAWMDTYLENGMLSNEFVIELAHNRKTVHDLWGYVREYYVEARIMDQRGS